MRAVMPADRFSASPSARPPDTISSSVTREPWPVTANVVGPAAARSVAGQPASVTDTATVRAALATGPLPSAADPLPSRPATNTDGTATEASPAAAARSGARNRSGAVTKASIGTAYSSQPTT